MALTYEPIVTTTIDGGSNGTSNIDFTSIPQTYTDLVITYDIITWGGNAGVGMYFNSDNSSGLYGCTYLVGATSYNVYSDDQASANNITTSFWGAYQERHIATTIRILNYTDTNKHKISLIHQNNPHGMNNGNSDVFTNIGLWRNTSAINSVSLITNGGIATGSTATIYGIKRA